MKIITVFLLFVLTGASSFATGPEDLQWAAQRQGDLLFLHWKDKRPQTNSCGFTVERFEYIPKLKSLSLDVRRNLCAYDFLDHSQGVHIWRMPYYLVGGGELHLFLHGQTVGTLILDSEGVALELGVSAEGDK